MGFIYFPLLVVLIDLLPILKDGCINSAVKCQNYALNANCHHDSHVVTKLLSGFKKKKALRAKIKSWCEEYFSGSPLNYRQSIYSECLHGTSLRTMSLSQLISGLLPQTIFWDRSTTSLGFTVLQPRTSRSCLFIFEGLTMDEIAELKYDIGKKLEKVSLEICRRVLGEMQTASATPSPLPPPLCCSCMY